MSKLRTDQQGYVALLTVLVVGAACTIIALGLLMTGIDNQRSTLVTQQSAQARNLATACAEEALQVINSNTAFTGTASLTLSTGSCTYTVTNTGGSNRTINAVGASNTTTRRVVIYATINTSSISIVSWQEVGDAI